MFGIIGGTSANFPLVDLREERISTAWGEVAVETGVLGGRRVAFVRRHGAGHTLLSSSVNHRANIAALAEVGVRAILATTVCGIVDPGQPLATALVFDDLFFPDNRLPEGGPCTFYNAPGDPRRGHYIFGSPFSPTLRAALLGAAAERAAAVRSGGTYAYALGPRFNTAAEIAWFRAAGACAVSQTAGPEAVLAGELEIPYALVGFGVDYANGVQPEPTPVELLNANIEASRSALVSIVAEAVASASEPSFDTGFVYRFE